MKKLVLLSLVSLMVSSIWAADVPGQAKKMKANPKKPAASTHDRNNKPKTERSASLQKVVIGTSGNLNSVVNANCHQVEVDSALNTVLFIHRSDTVFGVGSANDAQYRYDISRNGGTTWQVNVGPLNPGADNITIGGRFPQGILMPDSAYPTIVDSAWLVYNGSWNNVTPGTWQGQYYGVGQLSGDTLTYTQHPDVVNNGNIEVGVGMIESTPGHFWNLNLNYVETSTTSDTIRGIILERGVWNDSAGEVIWSYQYINIGTAIVYNAGAVVGNDLSVEGIAFDPTGQYGYILMLGDTSNDLNFTTRPILMHSTDYGATWSAPDELALENIPGMFTENASATNGGKTALLAQIAVDSAGNPHIGCIVAQNDTTDDGYTFYIFQQKVLYDLYYNPSVSGCSWQANFLSNVFGYSAYYTSDDVGDANRLQISHSLDGKKIFMFWTDTDSSTVAGITDVNNTNPNPNLFGIGIDMGVRKVTNVMDFTAGDPMFGGAIPELGLAAGTLTGALFPVVAQHILNQGGGNFNIPVVLTEPDYLDANFTTKSYLNPARYWYCQNINFTQSDFINKFDNAPPTLTVAPPDTQWVLLGTAYTPPTATAYDCTYGAITPVYSSTVPTNGSGITTAIGIYMSTWTATNPAGNAATATQTVIVAAPPIARIWDTCISNFYKFDFRDSSLNYDTARYWSWGDNTHTGGSYSVTKTYTSTTAALRMVILQVWNRFGTSSDTIYLQTYPEGVTDQGLSDKINVYPIPSSGLVTMDLADDVAKGANVYVYNIMGQQVGEAIEVKPNITTTVLNLTNLASGAYMLRVVTPTGTAVKQITINK